MTIDELYNEQEQINYNYSYNPDGFNTIIINNVVLNGVLANKLYKSINDTISNFIKEEIERTKVQTNCASEIRKVLNQYHCYIEDGKLYSNSNSIGVEI